MNQLSVPNEVDEGITSGNYLYTTSGAGLLIYNIGSGQSTPVTQVTIPTNTGVSIVPNSFNIVPSDIVTRANSETLEWDPVSTGSTSETITWQEAVTGLEAGESIPVVQGARSSSPVRSRPTR